MNMDILIQWGGNMLSFFERQQKEASSEFDPEQLEKKLGWITRFREQLEEWEELIQIITVTESFVRKQGLYRDSSLELRELLTILPHRERTKKVRAQLLAFRVFSEVAQRTYSQERNSLRSEKERPWGLRTYRPFRGQLQDAKPSFMEMLRIAEEVIDEIGMPMPSKSRGRPRAYDWKQILAVLLCKGVSPFSDLERKLPGYCEVDGRTPCDSERHYVYSKIPKDWLDKALKRLDDKITELYAKFGEFLNEFVIDGTGIACDSLEVRVAALQQQLAKETEEITILTRITTNTVRAMSSHTNKIPFCIP
jgi:hypothetical protein